MDLLTVGVVVVVLLVLGLLTGFVFGKQAKAKISNKLHGKDWVVRSETAFPLRTNCYVELYQDAAVCPGFPPPIVDGNGQPIHYVPGACWENVFNAINEAERFIYITGWSVDTSKTLLRTTRNSASGGEDETIGELLKRKAEEGCQVLIHLWNEKMSMSTGDQVHSSGLMGIHDEDTLVFFRNTPVKVVLSYRHGESSDYSLIFTHHQKSVIVDAPVLAEVEQSKIKGEQKKEKAKLNKKEKKEMKKLMKKEKAEEESGDGKKEKKDKKKKHSDSEDSGDEKKKKDKKKKDSDSEDSEDEKKKKDKKKKDSDSESEDKKKKDKKESKSYLPEQYSKRYQDYQEKLKSKLSTAGKRRIIAFIGGLDLTDGRWDTPVHSLYRTLKHEHSEDFHNVWPVSSELGPREPWHDIHCKLEGPVARDVLENFVQRWRKQAPRELHDLLFDTSPKNGFISIEQEQGNYKDPNELWNVQLFRSIDHHSATISGIDASIQECYINAIRHAERFIYVENQYFLGSCQYWEKDKDVGCTNVIPFEIVNKICSKIRNKEQFNVYAVIPMYPEGIPEDGAVQEVLFWQYRTQAFMNLAVYRTIEEVFGSSPNKPQVSDYLNFYCLGARETAAGSEAQVHDPMMLPNATEMDKAIHAARRFCVYVHSKMMIVDDAYVVVGSANINERSMSGYRDTEIAMGAFQPAYYSGPGADSAGKVHQFRLSLWAEHTGISHPIFTRPNTVDCAQLMNRLADENWEAFIGKEVVDLKGHLLRYPIRVDPATGKTISTVEFIPETKGKFRGTKSFILADKLTS